MAASGIHRYLKDPGASWPDKLKVARYAWATESCYIPNKYQVLLNWSCHAIANGDFSEGGGEDHLASLWTYLREIIQSETFLQESLTIPGLFYDALHRTLQKKIGQTHHSDALQVTWELFKQPQLCGKLLAKADSSIDILSSLLRLLRKDIKKGNLNSLLSITQHALQVFAEKYKFRVINKKVFEDITEKVLLMCLCLHRKSASLPLQEAIRGFLVETLFSEDLMPRYEDFLHPKKTFESATSVQKMVESVVGTMTMMKKVLSSGTMDKDTTGVLSGIPLLYKLFITALKPRQEISFLMLKKYLEVLGFSETEESWEGSECHRSSVMDSVDALLFEVHHHEVYSVLDDEAAGGKGKAYLRHLTKQVVALNQWTQPSWYCSLQRIFSLDYNLIVKHQTVVLRAAISRASSEEGNHDNDMNKLCEAKLNLLKEVSNTYLRMRQFPAFCNFLIRSCSLEDTGYTDIWLSPKFISQFGSMVQTLPLQMSLSIWTALKSALSKQIKGFTSDLRGETLDPPPNKRRREEQPDPGLTSCNHLEAIGVLLGTFVRNCRVVEFSGVPHGAATVKSLMQGMVVDVMLPSMEALAGLDEDAAWQDLEPFAFTTLFIACCHGDVRLLLYNFLRDGSGLTNDSLPSVEVGRIHGYLSKVTWEDVHASCGRFGSGRIMYLTDALAYQQIKLLILRPDGDGEDTNQSLGSLTGKVCFPTNLVERFRAWSGAPHTITATNYQTAQLHQLTQHYPMLSPHMAEYHRSDFADLVCQALFSSSGRAGGDSGYSGRGLALGFLTGDMCMESRELHDPLVSRAIQQLSMIMERRRALISRKPTHSSTAGPPIDLAQVLSDPSKLPQYMRQVKSTDTPTDHYQENQRIFEVFIKVLSTVPTKFVSVSNQTLCLLSLHVIDFHLTATEGVPTQETLQLLTDVRRLIAEFIREVAKTDLLTQVNFKSLINEFVTNHLMLNERVLEDQSCESLVSLQEVNRHTSELLSHWLRRESIWTGGTGHCIRSLTKKLKSCMEANINSALNHVSLIDLGAVVIKHSAKHPKSLPSNFGEYSSSLHHFLEASIGQVKSSSRCAASVSIFSLSAVSNFFLLVPDVGAVVGDTPSEYKEALLDLGTLRALWVKDLLSLLPELFLANGGDGSSALIRSANGQSLRLVKTACADEGIQKRAWGCLYQLLGVYGASTELVETVKFIVPRLENQYLQQLLTESISSVRSGTQNPISCTASLRLWQILPYAELGREQLQTLSGLVPQLIEQSTLLIQEVDAGAQTGIISVLFESVASVINQGTDLLDGEAAVSSLSLCLLVKLDTVLSESFHSIFQAVSRVVNSLMQTFPKSVQRSSHSYVAVLQHLLRNVMKRGQQTLEDTIPDEQLVLCAEDMERLLSCFSSFKDTKQVACFLLATFFQDLQEGTLLPFVKKILVLGMYHLVGSADFKSLDSVQSMMPDGLREIYKSFIEGFHKDHRFKGNI